MLLYQQIAFVCNYSESLSQSLKEVFKLKKMFGTKLMIVCFGKNTQNLNHLQSLVGTLHEPQEDIPIYWEHKQNITKTLTLCYKHGVDLLIQEASTRPKQLQALKLVSGRKTKEKYYLNSFARRMLRKSSCSILFLLNQKTPPQQGKGQLLISTNEHSDEQLVLRHGFAWAENADLKQVFILKEAKMMGLSLILSDAYTEQEATAKHHSVIAEEAQNIYRNITPVRPIGLNVKVEVSSEKAGYELARFSSVIQADLLVANLSDYQYNFMQRFIPNHLEYILNNLPCSLLLVNHQN